jgi:hypothetical protein
MFFEGAIVGRQVFAGAVAEDYAVVMSWFGPLVGGGGPMEVDLLDELAHGRCNFPGVVIQKCNIYSKYGNLLFHRLWFILEIKPNHLEAPYRW